jgi:hypothetical protein
MHGKRVFQPQLLFFEIGDQGGVGGGAATLFFEAAVDPGMTGDEGMAVSSFHRVSLLRSWNMH